MTMANAKTELLPLEVVRKLSPIADATSSSSSKKEGNNNVVVDAVFNAGIDENIETINNDHYYEMVAFDLDGTLLRSNRTISDETVEYLQDMSSRRGILIAVCTGRSFQSALPHLKRLNLSKPIPVVCINGAKGMLIDPLLLQDDDGDKATTHNNNNNNNTTTTTMTTLFRNPLSESATQTIKRVAKSLGHVTVWYHDEAAYAYAYSAAHVRLVKIFERLTKSTISIVRKDENDNDDTAAADESSSDRREELGPPSRIVVLFLDRAISDIAAAFESEFNDGEAYVVPGSKTLYVEILGADVHKGRGLRELCRSINVPLERCVAIGDGDNDTEFLSMAGFGICMKNGSKGSKAAANVVTEFTNDEDGVLRSLRQLEESGILQFSSTTTTTTTTVSVG
jgi:HAD superfamily hydrolase (TIGR01484 family)